MRTHIRNKIQQRKTIDVITDASSQETEAERCCWFDPIVTTGLWVLAHWVSTAGSSGWSLGAPRAPSSRVSKDLCFTHRSWLLPGLPLIVIPRGSECLLRLEGCGYSACRQSSSQHLQLQGPWHSFSSVSCVPSPAWRVSCCAGHRQPSNIFFSPWKI